MKCGQAEKWMDAALDELSGAGAPGAPAWTAARHGEFEAHLGACPACRRQWEALRSAEAVLRVPKPVPAPETLLADFRRRLADEEQRSAPVVMPSRRGGSGWRWLWPLGSLAAAGVAAAAVLMFNIQAPLSSIQNIRGQRQAPSAAAAPSTPSFENQYRSAPAEGERLRSKMALSVPTDGDVHSLAQERKPAPEALQRKPSLQDRAPENRAPENWWSFRGAPSKDVQSDFQTKQLSPGAAMANAHPVAPTKLAKDLALAERENSRSAATLRADVTAGKPVESETRAEAADKNVLAARQATDNLMGLQKQSATNFGANLGQQAQVKSQSLNYLYSSNAAQVAQNNSYYYAQVPVEPTPVELNVSAAVLNALQRPVELRSANVQVQALAEQLATEADVELKVDPRIAQLSVSVDEAGTPLWRVLEDVAHQTQTVIYPRDNALVLRPSGPADAVAQRGRVLDLKVEPDPKAKSDLSVRSRGVPPAPKAVTEATPPAPAPPAAPLAAGSPAGPKGPSGPAGPRGPAGGPVRGFGGLADAPSGGLGGGAGTGGFGRSFRAGPSGEAKPRPDGGARYASPSRQPDRRVWPAAWGNLPERGFEVPTADELPPLVLAPVQVGTTLSNEVPQVPARVDRLSRKKSEAESKSVLEAAKKRKPAAAKPK